MKRLLALAAGTLIPAVAGWCGPAEDSQSPSTIRMTVRPAAEPEPALKYRFLPELADQEPGNAALLYYRMLERINTKDDAETLRKWLAMPPGELPRKDVNTFLKGYAVLLGEAERAARRDQCDWAFPIREEGFNMVLPPLTKFRHLGYLLALQARMQIVEGETPEAVRTLQTGFALARHQADGQLLVNCLVGAAIAETMLPQVRQLSQAPDAPNLYWALASLPTPAIDLRKGALCEAEALYLWFPAFRDVHRRPVAQQDWENLFKQIMSLTGSKLEGKLAMTALAMKLYPRAKSYLARRGYTAQRIDAMPVRQVLAIYMVDSYERLRDDMFKWFFVPYWQAREGFGRAERALAQAGAAPDMPGFPLTMLLPVVGRSYYLQARLDRRIAALRCIEAVRIYAAAHDGRLPASLSDVREVPVPINPVTGGPFAYKATGNAFVLEAAAPDDMSPKETDRYEVTVVAP